MTTRRVPISRRVPQKKSLPWGAIFRTVGIAIFALAVLGLLGYFVLKPRRTYVVDYGEKPAIERDGRLDSAPKTPTYEELFSDEQIMLYYQGKGLKLPLIVHNDPLTDYKDNDMTFQITPWMSYYETGDEERRAYVEKMMASYNEHIEKFLAHRPVTITLQFVVDDTTPSKDKQVPQASEIKTVLGNLNLGKLTQQGDTVELFANTISASEHINGKKFSFIPEDAAVESKSKDAASWLVDRPSGKTTSSVSGGFAAILNQLAGKRNVEVHVFSDLIENYGATVNLYEKRELVENEKNWAQLSKILDAYAPLPKDLTGIKIRLYAPKGDDGLVKATQKYWANRLTKLGAEVTTYYGIALN